MPGPEPTRLLLLGGTAEGAALARRLNRENPDLRVITSLAGRLPGSRAAAGALRVGGFDGAEGLAAYIGEARIGLVVDATHPFAARMSDNARRACDAAGVARLILMRPPWAPPPGARWHAVADNNAAAALLHGLGRRCFITVGRGGLEAYARREDQWFLVRLMTPSHEPLPLVRAHLAVGLPPFTVSGERALMAEHRIEVLVTKNSGGFATGAKIVAARDLGLPMVVIERPPPPPGERLATVEAAVAWVRRRLDSF